MDKYAAEKIAQEYYKAGIKLAFYQSGIKTARPDPYETGLMPLPTRTPSTLSAPKPVKRTSSVSIPNNNKPRSISPFEKELERFKPTLKPKGSFFQRYGNKDVMPTAKDQQNLRQFRESIDRGVPDTRLGKTEVFRGPTEVGKFRVIASNREMRNRTNLSLIHI